MESVGEDWEKQGQELLVGMKDWRKEHPKATLNEIEKELDLRMRRLRSELLTDLAQASEAAEWTARPVEERPKCPKCGERLASRGRQLRTLQTLGGETLRLERHYGQCPSCGEGLFPPG